MTSPGLDSALHELRAAALRAIARIESIPAKEWHIEHSMSGPEGFEAAIDRLRESRPWYAVGIQALRYRVSKFFQ